MKRLLFALLLICSHSSLYAADRYISTTGTNSGGCTDSTSAATACRTWAFVIPLMVAGDTLHVYSGDYRLSTTGLPMISCSAEFFPGRPVNAVSGTSNDPITIRAITERGAYLNGSTSDVLGRDTFELHGCSYWVIDGLRMSNGVRTDPAQYGDVVFVTNASNLTFRRNLLHDTNTYNVHLAAINSCENCVFEENEGYNFIRHGFIVANGSNIVFRRNYVNSNNYLSQFADGGGITCYTTGVTEVESSSCNNWIVENNITETSASGIRLRGITTSTGTRWYGNIAIGHVVGFSAEADDAEIVTVDMKDNVALEASDWGFLFADPTASTCTNCSAFNSTGSSSGNGQGIASLQTPNTTNHTASTSLTITNSLALGNFNIGIFIDTTHVDTFTINFPASSDNADNYSPNATNGNVTNEFTNDAGSPAPTNMGGATGCFVYVHPASNLKEAGLAGADIGANIVFRYVNGVLGVIPLWDSDGTGTPDGLFPKGATVAGVNDGAGTIADVETRLRIDTINCPLPDAGGTDPGTPPLDNFEEYTVGAVMGSGTTCGGVGWVGVCWFNNGSNTASIQVPPAGSVTTGKAMFAQNAGGAFNVEYARQSESITVGTVPFYIRMSDCSPSAGVFNFILEEGGTDRMRVNLSGGNWRIAANGGGFTTIGTCAVNTWHQITLDFDDSAQPNLYRAKLDGGAYSSYITVEGGSYAAIDLVRIQNTVEDTHEMYLDDIGTATCAAAELAFTDQPASAIIGQSLGTVTVGVMCADGETLVTSATNTVTIANTGGTCTGMTLAGDTSNAAVTGTATFTDLNETVATGACTLTATAMGLDSAVSSSITITTVPVVGAGRAKIKVRAR